MLIYVDRLSFGVLLYFKILMRISVGFVELTARSSKLNVVCFLLLAWPTSSRQLLSSAAGAGWSLQAERSSCSRAFDFVAGASCWISSFGISLSRSSLGKCFAPSGLWLRNRAILCLDPCSLVLHRTTGMINDSVLYYLNYLLPLDARMGQLPPKLQQLCYVWLSFYDTLAGLMPQLYIQQLPSEF